MYQTQNLESVFAEIILPNQTNIIVGTIYKHPKMSIDSFNFDFLTPLLHKVSLEKKKSYYLGTLILIS